jgi:hypothetical protein
LAASRIQYFAIGGFDVKAFQNFAWNQQDSSQVSRDDKRILFAVSRWGGCQQQLRQERQTCRAWVHASHYICTTVMLAGIRGVTTQIDATSSFWRRSPCPSYWGGINKYCPDFWVPQLFSLSNKFLTEHCSPLFVLAAHKGTSSGLTNIFSLLREHSADKLGIYMNIACCQSPFQPLLIRK